ncbi:DUF4157 domain-containing protein, partial [Actinophytocola sp.]|uniref:eCIS core domain-containing protein n=1 Tax=Actinophytocola sp. TaxID=1872138 RepID=UPI003899835D
MAGELPAPEAATVPRRAVDFARDDQIPQPAELVLDADVTERPVPAAVSAKLTRVLGVDTSGVTVRRGPAVDRVAEAFNARGFTVAGVPHVPDTMGPLDDGPGAAALAHELTHVVQQHLPDTADAHRMETQATEVEDWFNGTAQEPVWTADERPTVYFDPPSAASTPEPAVDLTPEPTAGDTETFDPATGATDPGGSTDLASAGGFTPGPGGAFGPISEPVSTSEAEPAPGTGGTLDLVAVGPMRTVVVGSPVAELVTRPGPESVDTAGASDVPQGAGSAGPGSGSGMGGAGQLGSVAGQPPAAVARVVSPVAGLVPRAGPELTMRADGALGPAARARSGAEPMSGAVSSVAGPASGVTAGLAGSVVGPGFGPGVEYALGAVDSVAGPASGMPAGLVGEAVGPGADAAVGAGGAVVPVAGLASGVVGAGEVVPVAGVASGVLVGLVGEAVGPRADAAVGVGGAVGSVVGLASGEVGAAAVVPVAGVVPGSGPGSAIADAGAAGPVAGAASSAMVRPASDVAAGQGPGSVAGSVSGVVGLVVGLVSGVSAGSAGGVGDWVGGSGSAAGPVSGVVGSAAGLASGLSAGSAG